MSTGSGRTQGITAVEAQPVSSIEELAPAIHPHLEEMDRDRRLPATLAQTMAETGRFVWRFQSDSAATNDMLPRWFELLSIFLPSTVLSADAP